MQAEVEVDHVPVGAPGEPAVDFFQPVPRAAGVFRNAQHVGLAREGILGARGVADRDGIADEKSARQVRLLFHVTHGRPRFVFGVDGLLPGSLIGGAGRQIRRGWRSNGRGCRDTSRRQNDRDDGDQEENALHAAHLPKPQVRPGHHRNQPQNVVEKLALAPARKP